MTASRSSEVCWNSETILLLRLFAELKNRYFDKPATELKFIALVAYPAHVVRLKLTNSTKSKLTDQSFSSSELLLVGIAELGAQHGDPEVKKRAI